MGVEWATWLSHILMMQWSMERLQTCVEVYGEVEFPKGKEAFGKVGGKVKRGSIV